jgi:chromate transporter
VAAMSRPRHEPRLVAVFLEFLKLGVVVFGSGYVLLAFLHRDLVTGYGWISTRELLDAVAVGQFTPGPVFTTATFVGYLLAGVPGAAVATLGIFLPSFVFVGFLGPIVRRMRASTTAGAALDGVNAAALGLMAAVLVDLAGDAVCDVLTGAVAAVAAVVLWRTKLSSTWLIAGGATLGLLHAAA